MKYMNKMTFNFL